MTSERTVIKRGAWHTSFHFAEDMPLQRPSVPARHAGWENVDAAREEGGVDADG